MIPKVRGIAKVFFFIVAALYPAFIFYFLVIRKVETRLFSLFVMAFALLAFITGTGLSFRRMNGGPNQKDGKTRGAPPLFWNFLLLFALGALCLVVNSSIILKFYPLLMNGLFLAAFGSTLFFPPSMIFRFATIQDKSIRGSLTEKRVSTYCRKVTLVWCAFFVLNGSVAAWTIFFGTDALWSVYNGGISYILIGILFTGEFIVRKIVQKKIPEAVPLSKFKINSRPLSTVLCYEGRWSDAVYKTWGDFLQGTTKLRQQIDSVNSDKWLLHCEDYWLFLLAFTSLLQCKKEILLSANVSPDYIAEIRGMETQGRVPFLTDKSFSEDETPEDVFFIPSLLQEATEVQAEEAPVPQINPDETSIIIYTSGSTGKPKAVKQRMTEFENDNRFVLSKWGEEFLKRKLCSTVSQHHIYGLLFSILLPLTAGVPFRRTRIEFPEELETFSDTEYMIITVPAFLKRAVQIERRSSLNLLSPWIFTSGGAVDPETAKKTSEVFGFWPVEVYGSTETSGIAWRQSVNGQEWTPFENAQISLNKEGCLLIRSPYIKDTKGFETADMAEILEDGRFLLKGRIDSVVKIEEKRVSLSEIESRITQSGLAADACVIPLHDKRQYLAAAVVFNEQGKERFASLEKHAVNTFWREYLSRYFENVVIPKKWRYPDALPLDAQGKKSREKIELLFTEGKTQEGSAGFNELPGERLIERIGNTVSLEFSVPEDSSYFDGHFPGFPILPAVAQADIVLRYAARYLGTGLTPSEIRRMKFINLIRPLTPHLLRIEKKGETLVFTITSLSGEVVYSTGTFAEKS
jgi:uncharacterized membrane protein/acyl-CoA synthetase (AMP-forming)/AMP-acid ligase II/3-hydroxymyristoyl/3-hydroxydecanoyl-(acyl carrier protein) dehydratase